MRDRRELQTLCSMMDHYALGRFKEAADVATQRLKSICYANSGGSWDSCQYMELIPPDLQEKLLTNSDLSTEIKERESRGKLNPHGFWKAKGGKGYYVETMGEYGKGKGKYGKDKGKGKYGKDKGKGKGE